MMANIKPQRRKETDTNKKRVVKSMVPLFMTKKKPAVKQHMVRLKRTRKTRMVKQKEMRKRNMEEKL